MTPGNGEGSRGGRAKGTYPIPKSCLEQILRTSRVPHVGESAINMLGDVLESLAREIATRATELARHRGHVTVMEADIRLAFKQLREERKYLLGPRPSSYQ